MVVYCRSSTQGVLPENENPSGRRERPFLYLIKLYYQRTKIHQVRRERLFQYLSCTTRERICIKLSRTAVLQYLSCTTRERKSIKSPGTAVPVLKLYYQRTKSHQVAENGCSSIEVALPESEIHQVALSELGFTKVGIKSKKANMHQEHPERKGSCCLRLWLCSTFTKAGKPMQQFRQTEGESDDTRFYLYSRRYHGLYPPCVILRNGTTGIENLFQHTY